MTDNTTPVVRCPKCNHAINSHTVRGDGCETMNESTGGNLCACRMLPNEIAVAAVHTALYGDLTQPTTQHIRRQPDGSWS